jgi:exopolysaccharide production protein ExoY
LGGAIKRAVDISLALGALVLLAPLMIMVAAALRICIGRPIISEQKLVGFGGKVFTAYQFRTDSGDPVVACLRTSGLCKLPQLVNVLRGDMSFVGPYPFASEECGRNPPGPSEYFMARPGLTGLWHSWGTDDPHGFRRAASDRYYVRRWSLGLDLLLLIKSVVALRDK